MILLLQHFSNTNCHQIFKDYLHVTCQSTYIWFYIKCGIFFTTKLKTLNLSPPQKFLLLTVCSVLYQIQRHVITSQPQSSTPDTRKAPMMLPTDAQALHRPSTRPRLKQTGGVSSIQLTGNIWPCHHHLLEITLISYQQSLMYAHS